jgi:hypothetical protein
VRRSADGQAARLSADADDQDDGIEQPVHDVLVRGAQVYTALPPRQARDQGSVMTHEGQPLQRVVKVRHSRGVVMGFPLELSDQASLEIAVLLRLSPYFSTIRSRDGLSARSPRTSPSPRKIHRGP